MLRSVSFKTCFLLLLFVLFAQSSVFAVVGTFNVSATVLSKSNCKFYDKTATLAFGNLDPVSATDITRQVNLSFVCNGSATFATYLITDDNGLNESAPNGNRMLHDSVASTYLPYSLSLSTTADTVKKGDKIPLVVTGTILGNDYRTAMVGSYSDTVTITINP